MFSSRLDWNIRPNPIASLLDQKRLRGDRILDLTESNPTQAGIVYPAGGIAAAFSDERAVRYEPAAGGLASAREAVSGYYAARGIGVDPSRILLCASTSEAYSYLFKLLADPGDEILAPGPSYPLFDYLAKLESITIRQYPLFYDYGWHIDYSALESMTGARTRAIVLVNPNNPTGSYLKRAELHSLRRLCAKHNLALISDEVFSDYAFGSDPERVESLAGIVDAPVFSLSGLSKIVGLPQMKLGWMVIGDGASYERLELIADTYLSVGTPVQLALPRLLEMRHEVQRQILARTSSNLEWLSRVARPLKVEGGWYSILRVPNIRSEEEWVLELLRRGVLVQPGFFYDFQSGAYLVVSLLTPEDVFREGLAECLRMVQEV
jgi:aspartate/methionine/tyrosine aminotransferase